MASVADNSASSTSTAIEMKVAPSAALGSIEIPPPSILWKPLGEVPSTPDMESGSLSPAPVSDMASLGEPHEVSFKDVTYAVMKKTKGVKSEIPILKVGTARYASRQTIMPSRG